MASSEIDEVGTPELSRLVTYEELERGPVTRDIIAGEAERRALAERFGILRLNRLEARVTLWQAGDEVMAEGEIGAAVRQSCVVTLEPVESTIASRFSVRYMSPDDFAELTAGEEGEEVLGAEEEDIEPLPAHGIDMGEVVAQYMALALDPYPRKEGAELGPSAETGGEGGTRENPFSVLRKLQDRG